MTRVTVLGTEIDSTTQNEAVDRAMTAMHERKGAFVITPNAEYLLHVQKSRCVGLFVGVYLIVIAVTHLTFQHADVQSSSIRFLV